MLEAGARFVAEQGGQILEGYPVDAGSRKYPGSFAWVGLASAYERAGFTEVARAVADAPDHAANCRGLLICGGRSDTSLRRRA